MRTVEASIETTAAAERVIEAFLSPEALAAWWGVGRALVQPRVGGLYALAWDIRENSFGFLATGIVGALEPRRLLRIDSYAYFHPHRPILGPMTLTVEASGSSLRVTQAGYQQGPDWDWYYEAVRDAWPRVVADVKRYLEK